MPDFSTKNWTSTALVLSLLLCGACEAPSPSGIDARATHGQGAEALPNVLLITIDTLRADRLPVYGYDGIETPALSALAKHGTVFENGRSHAPITLPSHASILTGLYPPQHGVRSNGSFSAAPELETVAERLSSAGYTTAAFVSAFVLDSRFGLDQGFDHYDDDLEDGRPTWSKFGVKDRQAGNTVDRALAWFQSQPEEAPYFAWVHFYDPHFEYAAPEPFASRYANPYDAEIAYTDAQIGRLLDGLRGRPGFDEMLIVVTSDHGESFGEHGESTHSLFVYEATQHVPMIVRFPSGTHAGTRSEITARHVDIVPTILGATGVVTTGDPMAGRSLLRAIDDGEAPNSQKSYAEAMIPKEQFGWSSLHAFEESGYKYIEAPHAELYNLSLDRTEQVNLLEIEPERAAEMSTALIEFRERLTRYAAPSEREEMDAETRAHLTSLGYLFDDAPRQSAQGSDPKDMIEVHEARERIHALMSRGRYGEAIQLSEALIMKDPTNHAITQDLAACHAELGQWEKALQYYEEIAAAKPDNAGAYIGIAKIRFKGYAQFERAEAELEVAMTLAPNDPAIWGVRGDLFHEMGRYAEAATSYQHAIDSGDQTASYLLGWASALNLTNRLEEARDAIERAVRLEPSNAIAHFNHGVILKRMGLPAIANGAFREALRLEPGLVQARAALVQDQRVTGGIDRLVAPQRS